VWTLLVLTPLLELILLWGLRLVLLPLSLVLVLFLRSWFCYG